MDGRDNLYDSSLNLILSQISSRMYFNGKGKDCSNFSPKKSGYWDGDGYGWDQNFKYEREWEYRNAPEGNHTLYKHIRIVQYLSQERKNLDTVYYEIGKRRKIIPGEDAIPSEVPGWTWDQTWHHEIVKDPAKIIKKHKLPPLPINWS
jgi:hypothetical protein